MNINFNEGGRFVTFSLWVWSRGYPFLVRLWICGIALTVSVK